MVSLRKALATARSTGSFVVEDQRLDSLPRELLDIRRLHTVKVTRSQIETLPDWFGDLKIETLDLHGNKFKEFPPSILTMPELRTLGLSGNHLQSLPTDIARLRKLESLAVPNCRLTAVPESLRNLANLIELDLGLNHITELDGPSLPPAVEHLVMYGNDFTVIPEAVRSLSALRVLELSSAGNYSPGYDDAAGIGRPHWRSTVTRTVGVSTINNRGNLATLPAWLFDLAELEWLDLTGQQIEGLPDAIGKLTKLRGLLLAGNKLQHLPDSLFTLNSLKVLNVSGNELKTIPDRLPNLSRLSYLGLSHNDLPIPPEILARPDNPKDFEEYLTRTREDRRPLNEAKLLVVGEGSVGKSSIIRRLTRGDFNPDERKTEGIDVTHWGISVEGADIAVNLWDFGGQEIMHATHQFFLTRRSVYLLVVDARQSEEQNRIEYWLKLIQGFSAGSPVILVGNKCEEFGLDIDQRGLRHKYPDIVDIVESSCVNNLGIDAIRESVRHTLGALPHVRDLLPTSFFAVKAQIEKLDADYLPFTTYQELCRERGVSTSASQELLVSFLHDLGTVLCFRKDPRLRDTNILNPGWVTGGVYRLLNSHLAAQAKGLLTWPDIDRILDDAQYLEDKRQFIIEMMKKFELCYESDEVFLIPDLLTKEEPDTGSWQDSLHFIVRYEVLPSSIIGRLIVRLHHLISQGTVWRTGVVLAIDNNRALVKVDREDGILTIKIAGPAKSRRGLLTAIRAELRTIERTIPGLAGEEQVPVPGHPQVWVPHSHLLNLESAGKEVVVPQGLVDEFPINQLLDGVESRADREATRSLPDTRQSVPDQPEDQAARPGRRFRFLGKAGFAGLLGLIGTIATIVGLLIALLSYLGDERERNKPSGPAGPATTSTGTTPARQS